MEMKHCWFYLVTILVVTCFSIELIIETFYVSRILPIKDGIFELNDLSQNVSLNCYFSQNYLWNGFSFFLSRYNIELDNYNVYTSK
jgi:hypothetical protein